MVATAMMCPINVKNKKIINTNIPNFLHCKIHNFKSENETDILKHLKIYHKTWFLEAEK